MSNTEYLRSAAGKSGGRSRLVALSAPSGAGKSTICRMLLERNPDFRLSVSATTRPSRPREVAGTDYYFLTMAEFRQKIEAGEFLEYEEVHGNYYGTLISSVESFLAEGYTVLFDIDVHGALSLKNRFPAALLIFIQPPSLEILRHRLRERRTDNEDEIIKRLQRLPEEYTLAGKFDHVVINDNLQTAVRDIEALING